MLSLLVAIFFSFPLAVLEGYFFLSLCVAAIIRLFLSTVINRTKRGDKAVYHVPNGPRIPETFSTLALYAAPRLSSTAAPASTACSGELGESRWRAARPARSSSKTALD